MNEFRIVLKVYLCPFGYQGLGQGGRGTVVSSHGFALREEVAYQGAHADTACSYEIYGFKKHFFFNLQIYKYTMYLKETTD